MRALLLLCLALLGSALVVRPTHAACLEPRESGEWTNVAHDTRSVVSLEVRFVCQDRMLNGAPYPPGPEWFVHAVGRCEGWHWGDHRGPGPVRNRDQLWHGCAF